MKREALRPDVLLNRWERGSETGGGVWWKRGCKTKCAVIQVSEGIKDWMCCCTGGALRPEVPLYRWETGSETEGAAT